MCSLFRIRRGSDKLSWLLSIPLPAARLLAGLAGKDVLAGSDGDVGAITTSAAPFAKIASFVGNASSTRRASAAAKLFLAVKV
jgi:hypothetical protein